jgi:hypothetical protein
MMKRILILLLFLPSVAFGQALITIDHTAIDMFDAGIPTYYINLVKQMTFHYQGASHARQMRNGMEFVEVAESKYAFEYAENPADFNEPNKLKELELGSAYSDDYFTDSTGRDALKSRIQASVSEGYTPVVSLFGWSYNMCNTYDGTYTNATIQEYIDAIAIFNADEDINDTIFVYHTSVMDGGCTDRESWNQMIRDAATSNNGILFDQADIEIWNNANTEATDGYTRNDDYDDISQGGDPPDTYPGGDARNEHSNDALPIRKAKAMWVLLATLAGWDGSSEMTDADADGSADDVDNCPDIWNPEQIDVDSDGTGDACDSDTIYGTVSRDVQAGTIYRAASDDVQSGDTVAFYRVNCGEDIEVSSAIINSEGYYSLGGLESAVYLVVHDVIGYSVKSFWVGIPQEVKKSYDFEMIAD